MRTPLSGGDYNGMVLDSATPLPPGDLIEIVGHESPLIPETTYRVHGNGVARHVPNPLFPATFGFMAHRVVEA